MADQPLRPQDVMAYRVGRLRLGPGDILVIKADSPIDPVAAQRLRQYGEAVTHGAHRVLVLDRSIDLAVLERQTLADLIAADRLAASCAAGLGDLPAPLPVRGREHGA